MSSSTLHVSKGQVSDYWGAHVPYSEFALPIGKKQVPREAFLKTDLARLESEPCLLPLIRSSAVSGGGFASKGFKVAGVDVCVERSHLL